MITITSLTHPTMIAKVRAALKDAAMGKGHLRGGHANRVYVQNRKGHNILRIDYKGAANGGFIAYGGADWGQTVVTDIVKAALVRSNITHTPQYKGTKLVGYKARIGGALGKLFGLGLIATTLTACNPHPGAGFSEFQWLSDPVIRAERFDACMKALPAGPVSTHYNDWSEVVDSCESAANSQSKRLAKYVSGKWQFVD